MSQAGPKTVTIGIQREPYALDQAMVGGASLTAGGASNVPPILHDYLSVPVGIEGREAHLAVELPSVEKGSWRTNADGTMDMTWQLRPNIKWQDGRRSPARTCSSPSRRAARRAHARRAADARSSWSP